MDKLKNYYKLCGIVPLKYQPNSIITQLDEAVLRGTFSEKQLALYIAKDDAGNIIRENIIGAKEKKKVI